MCFIFVFTVIFPHISMDSHIRCKNKNRRQKINIKTMRRNKFIPKEHKSKFYNLSNFHLNDLCIVSTGDLDPNNLTRDDKGKHGAIYVAIDSMPAEIAKKKYGDGNGNGNSKLLNTHKIIQEHARSYYSTHIPSSSTISVELMGPFQTKAFNKTEKWKDGVAIPHGALYVNIPTELQTYEGFEKTMESLPIEGVIVVGKNRYKLKREYFPKEGTERHKGPHTEPPSTDKGHYTDEGLALVGNDGLGYWNSFLAIVEQGNDGQVVIGKTVVDGYEVDVISRGLTKTITTQLDNPFKGQKMMNFFETTGSRNTYHYTQNIFDNDSLDENIEFQVKFNGETALIHKDKNGLLHLLVKLQIDVYEIEDSGFYFGWI